MNQAQDPSRETKSVASYNGLADFSAKFMAEVAQKPQFKHFAANFIPQALRMWAGDTTWKKMVARPVENTLRKSAEATLPAQTEPGTVLANPEMARLLVQQLPYLFNTGALTLSDFSRALMDLPAQDKEQLVSSVLQGIDYGKPGEAATALFQFVNELHQANPLFLTEHLGPAFETIIKNIDFGELDELYFNSQEDIAGLARAINGVFLNYPAKLVCLVGLLPGIANLMAVIVKENLEGANQMSPELITELLLSFMNDIDGKTVGQAINQFFELVRKVHTGSALIGPPGLPQLTQELTKKLAELGAAMDPDLMWKARMAFTELGEAKNNARIDLLRQSPDLLKEMLLQHPALRNAKLRASRNMVEVLEELEDGDLAEAVADGALKVDVQELSEVVNLLCMVANRVRAERPDYLVNTMAQFASSVDTYELSDAASWLVEDVGQAFKPLARAVIPKIIKGVAGWLEPEDDEYTQDVNDALGAMRNLFDQTEATS